jgi:ribonucleoside-diphosphate reductase beta chain
MNMHHEGFATTGRGLNREMLPMALWEKAKRYGIWNPADIDLTQDKIDFANLTDRERDLLVRSMANFQAGEEAVTLDLLPLIGVIAREGRLEEEMFLTSFLWEEAKHVDFFSRFLGEVTGRHGGLEGYVGPAYQKLFYDILPKNLHALAEDSSPEAQVRASTTYNMVVEGMLAETGYHIYFTVLDRKGIMPGFREGIHKLKLDESRHIAYGVYLLSRLIGENPQTMQVFDDTMNELFPIGYALIAEIFEAYGNDVPFGLDPNEFLEYATSQYQKRYARITRAHESGAADEEEELVEA